MSCASDFKTLPIPFIEGTSLTCTVYRRKFIYIHLILRLILFPNESKCIVYKQIFTVDPFIGARVEG